MSIGYEVWGVIRGFKFTIFVFLLVKKLGFGKVVFVYLVYEMNSLDFFN